MFIGFIMQCHYVGLDRLPVCSASVQQSDEALDDATVEEGDDHRRQISGAAIMASMMGVENPETSKDIICVAPAEGEKPLNIMIDSNFEAMSNPDKFHFGTGTFSSERPKKMIYIIRGCWTLMGDLLETLITCLLLSTLWKPRKYWMMVITQS